MRIHIPHVLTKQPEPQKQREPSMTPWIISALISGAVAAGMADWSDGQWTAFIVVAGTVVVSILGALFTGIAQVVRAFRENTAKLEEIHTAAQASIPPEQAQAIAQAAAKAATAETPPKVQT